MKKGSAVVVCALLLGLMSGLSNVSASAPSAVSFGAHSDNGLASYYAQYPLDESFGGVYYDGDTLVVNYAGDSARIAQPKGYSNAGSDMEYRPVRYSLQFLESVKDDLAAVMDQYGILVLDANEMTNQVDVSLGENSEEIKTAIRTFTDQRFGSSDFLNFIDLSGVAVQSTVAYECPDYRFPEQVLKKGK